MRLAGVVAKASLMEVVGGGWSVVVDVLMLMGDSSKRMYMLESVLNLAGVALKKKSFSSHPFHSMVLAKTTTYR